MTAAGRLTRLAPAAAAAAVLATGCHASACIGSGCDHPTIDTAKAESTTAVILAQQTGARIKAVSCPQNVALKAGASFTCTATGADGTTAPVLVTQKDAKGNVNISAPTLLHTGSAAKLIADRLTRQAKVAVTVRCPDLVAARKGTTLNCTATDPAGVSRRVAVTVTDAQGAISYRLR